MIHARLSFILAISCAALLRLEAAEAQQTGRLPRIGILATTPSAYSQVLRQAVGERGWVENRTVELDFRYHGRQAGAVSGGRRGSGRASSRCSGCRVGTGRPGGKQATTTIPIVMAVGDDPVEAGLVPSLTRPGSNLTGFSSFQPEPVSLSELIHRQVRVAIETAVHEELRTALGAVPYERSDARRGYRNGTKTRTLTGPTGLVALTVPRATLFSLHVGRLTPQRYGTARSLIADNIPGRTT